MFDYYQEGQRKKDELQAQRLADSKPWEVTEDNISKLIYSALVRGSSAPTPRQREDIAFKVLWRMANGSRSKAITIIKDLILNGFLIRNIKELVDYPDFECIVEDTLADKFGGGCEIEWTNN